MIAIDTNLLVYAHRSGAPEHRRARRAIEKARDDDRGWGIAMPSITEFWSVATHQASVGGPSTPRQAHSFLRELVDADAQVWIPRDGFWDRLLRIATDLRISGVRIFDLQIALVAFEGGASEVWTHDAGFSTVPGLAVHDPL